MLILISRIEKNIYQKILNEKPNLPFINFLKISKSRNSELFKLVVKRGYKKLKRELTFYERIKLISQSIPVIIYLEKIHGLSQDNLYYTKDELHIGGNFKISIETETYEGNIFYEVVEFPLIKRIIHTLENFKLFNLVNSIKTAKSTNEVQNILENANNLSKISQWTINWEKPVLEWYRCSPNAIMRFFKIRSIKIYPEIILSLKDMDNIIYPLDIIKGEEYIYVFLPYSEFRFEITKEEYGKVLKTLFKIHNIGYLQYFEILNYNLKYCIPIFSIADEISTEHLQEDCAYLKDKFIR